MYTQDNICGRALGHLSSTSNQHALESRYRSAGTFGGHINGSLYSSRNFITNNNSPFHDQVRRTFQCQQQQQQQQRLSHELLPLSSSSFNRYRSSAHVSAMNCTASSHERANHLSRERFINENSSPYTSTNFFQSHLPSIQGTNRSNHLSTASVNHRRARDTLSPILQSQMSLTNNLLQPSTANVVSHEQMIMTTGTHNSATVSNNNGHFVPNQVSSQSTDLFHSTTNNNNNNDNNSNNNNNNNKSSSIANLSSFILIMIALVIISFIVLSPVLHYVM